MAQSKKIGSLRLKQSEDGRQFFSGVLDLGVLGEVQIAIFRVTEKTTEKSPEYDIILFEPSLTTTQAKEEEGAVDKIPF